MDGIPHSEPRRRSLRRAIHTEVDVSCDVWDGTVPLLGTDLSLHGLWLESDLPLQAGSELTVSLVLPRWPSSTRFRARAKVERVGLLRRGSDRGRPGMGVSFLDLGTDAVAQLTRALRGLPPPIPEQSLRRLYPRRVVPLSSPMTAILSARR